MVSDGDRWCQVLVGGKKKKNTNPTHPTLPSPLLFFFGWQQYQKKLNCPHVDKLKIKKIYYLKFDVEKYSFLYLTFFKSCPQCILRHSKNIVINIHSPA